MNISKLIGIMVIGSFSFAANQEPDQRQDVLKVLTFNIDTNMIRTEEGYARDSHPQWRIGARMPAIQASLRKICAQHSPDVIHLQEGRKFFTKFGDEVDSITPLMELLPSLGYGKVKHEVHHF